MVLLNIKLNTELKQNRKKRLFLKIRNKRFFLAAFFAASLWGMYLYINPGSIFWKSESTNTHANIPNPPINPPNVQHRNVSGMDILLNLPIDQNPESFGRDKPTPPAQIAIAASIGETLAAITVGYRIEEVVVIATAVDPCAKRINCANTKPRINTGILKDWNTFAI